MSLSFISCSQQSADLQTQCVLLCAVYVHATMCVCVCVCMSNNNQQHDPQYPLFLGNLLRSLHGWFAGNNFTHNTLPHSQTDSLSCTCLPLEHHHMACQVQLRLLNSPVLHTACIAPQAAAECCCCSNIILLSIINDIINNSRWAHFFSNSSLGGMGTPGCLASMWSLSVL